MTISMGEICFVLKADGREPLQLTIEESALFTKFVHRVVNGAAGELISWENINETAGKMAPSDTSKQDPLIAKYLSNLNQRLTDWAIPPDAGLWIGTLKGKKGGRYLNTSVKWIADTERPLLKELARKSQSVSGPTVSGLTIGQHTPDRALKLPARPRGHGPVKADADKDNE